MWEKRIKKVLVGSMIVGVVVLGGCTLDQDKKTGSVKETNIRVGDWNRYDSDRMGFEIDYPESWIYTENFDEFEGNIIFFDKDDKAEEKSKYGEVEVIVEHDLDMFSPQDRYEPYKRSEDGEDYHAMDFEHQYDSNLRGYSKIVKGDNSVYVISFYGSKDDDTIQALFEKFNRSFSYQTREVRKPNISLDNEMVQERTENWSKYTDDKNKFSVKYPDYLDVIETPEGTLFATEERYDAMAAYREKSILLTVSSNEEPLEEIVHKEISGIQAGNGMGLYTEEIDVNGSKAIFIGGHYDYFGGLITKIYLKKGSKLFVLEARAVIYDGWSKEKEFAEDEFAFFYHTLESNSDCGKEYISKEHDFSVCYPENWTVNDDGFIILMQDEIGQEYLTKNEDERGDWPGYTVKIEIVDEKFEDYIFSEKENKDIRLDENNQPYVNSPYEIKVGKLIGLNEPDLVYIKFEDKVIKITSLAEEKELREIVESFTEVK
ncbi:hypothetical protein KKH43_05895 [Patescibacteria group bacterium]|nr:hypothetical protein [Patescibacteria group bacterium]